MMFWGNKIQETGGEKQKQRAKKLKIDRNSNIKMPRKKS